jgi:hypothetical protein
MVWVHGVGRISVGLEDAGVEGEPIDDRDEGR